MLSLGGLLEACLDAREELGQDDQIHDDGRGQQGVLTGVEQRDGVAAAHEDLTRVRKSSKAVCGHVQSHFGRKKLAWMRVSSSARMTRSRMMGAASRESSQVLCSAMVLRPPMKISLTYSSMARLLSAT